MQPPRTVPTAESERIAAIDAVRGAALLGIFLVNIDLFGAPLAEFLRPTPGGGLGESLPFYLVRIFCHGKSYPLFSMLFGMGLALQWQRARRAGRSFAWLGSRRMAVLMVIGLAHGVLLWCGDILFMYSLVGFAMLALIRASARTLAVVGSVLLVISVALSGGAAALSLLAPPPEPVAAGTATPGEGAAEAAEPSADEAAPGEVRPEEDLPDESPPGATLPEDASYDQTNGAPEPEAAGATEANGAAAERPTPIMRVLRAFKTGQVGQRKPPMKTGVWIEAETEAYREGPYTQALAMRAFTYAMFLIFSVFGFWWHVGAMVLFGAALMKAGLFTPERRHWPRRMAIAGLAVGLPASAAVALLPGLVPEGAKPLAMVAVGPATFVVGPLVSLGYLGATMLLVRGGAAPALTGALADAGRMALTNYLMQTVIATGIFYHWGLGLFGTMTRPERLGIVVLVYIAQLVFSVLWLRAFQFGPMEWLWRTLTYLRPQPLRRRGGG